MSTSPSVHGGHCCAKHGCKYGDEDCPVFTGKEEQAYPCETCTTPSAWRTLEEVKKVLVGKIARTEAMALSEMQELVDKIDKVFADDDAHEGL